MGAGVQVHNLHLTCLFLFYDNVVYLFQIYAIETPLGEVHCLIPGPRVLW